MWAGPVEKTEMGAHNAEGSRGQLYSSWYYITRAGHITSPRSAVIEQGRWPQQKA